MDHAVVGRKIADYACARIVVLAPAQDQLAPGHRGGDFAALYRLILSGMAFGASLFPSTT